MKLQHGFGKKVATDADPKLVEFREWDRDRFARSVTVVNNGSNDVEVFANPTTPLSSLYGSCDPIVLGSSAHQQFTFKPEDGSSGEYYGSIAVRSPDGVSEVIVAAY